jgi:transposase-like protein
MLTDEQQAEAEQLSIFMVTHKKIVHDAPKPTCEICGKSFTRRDVLQRHMKDYMLQLMRRNQHVRFVANLLPAEMICNVI